MKDAEILKIDKFRASTSFFYDLKTRFKMTCQKVTKIVIKWTRDDEDAIVAQFSLQILFSTLREVGR